MRLRGFGQPLELIGPFQRGPTAGGLPGEQNDHVEENAR